ncbi:unnamed protein product [Ranitomeya imitator]|uniref:Protein FAM161A n=1 Tax=Ranitomeya imitator TaxID=111125 RepID=A0ABN9MA11_9NEOB|nr:unnamed protein product [Ranitomeya imitator]
MASSHQDAVLAASCVRTPVNPRTRGPRTLYERQEEEEEKLRGRTEEPGLNTTSYQPGAHSIAPFLPPQNTTSYQPGAHSIAPLQPPQNTTSYQPGAHSIAPLLPQQNTTSYQPGAHSITPLLPPQNTTSYQPRAHSIAPLLPQQNTTSYQPEAHSIAPLLPPQNTTSYQPGAHSIAPLLALQNTTSYQPGAHSIAPLLPPQNTTSYQQIALKPRSCYAVTGRERDDFDSDSDSDEEQSCKMVTCKDWMLDISKLHHSDREYYMQLERLKNAHVVNMGQLEKMYDHKLHLHGVQNTQPSANADYWSEWEQKSSEPTECECCFLKHNVSSSGLSESSLDELSEGEDDSDTNDSISVAEKIGQMWNGFTVEDYIKKTDFVIHQSKQKVKKSKCKEWSHKVTIPQPFDMTIRESKKKEMNVKSKSEIEMENNLLKKRLEEEAECQKKFRANPVPASVYLPLYHEIVERNEERRNFVKDRSKEILQASQRPFLFTEREERKKQKKEMQLEDLPDSVHTFKHFKAKPVPKSIYGTSVNERLKEEELYRQIRIQMRSQELLHSSSYPTSTLACRTSPKSRCQQPKTKESHKPKINTQIPNFRVLHENHEKRFLKNKDTKHVTICDPFQLRTSNLASNKGKILKDIEADEEILKESRWPYKSPRNQLWKSSAGLLPLEDDTVVTPRSTESSKRREQAIRKSEKRQTKEYMEELGAMKERVSLTPLLLERASQVCTLSFFRYTCLSGRVCLSS